MFLRIFPLLFALVFVIACKESTEQTRELDAIYDEVMDLHDDVMLQMSGINKWRKQLKNNLDKVDPNVKTLYQNRINDLETADDAMYDWMKNIKKPDYKKFDKTKEYLLNEKKNIENIGIQINTAIENAKLALQEQL